MRSLGPRLARPGLALLAVLAACIATPPIIEPVLRDRPRVERLDALTVRVRWPESFATGPVSVRASTSPQTSRTGTLLGTGVGQLTLHSRTEDGPASDRQRLFYTLLPQNGGPAAIVAERRLPLEGADNFRDLGGYATANGRHVRWGRLYRSNALGNLTERDLEYLSQEKIQLVCDFRTEPVRRADPDPPIPPIPAKNLDIPVAQQGVNPRQMRERIRTGGISALGIRNTLLRAYRNFVIKDSDRWATLLERLSDIDNLPTVMHCTAGKDRTGFASALVLLTLGVPEEAVFEDYLLTNNYRKEYFAFVLRWAPLYSFFRTDPDDLLPLLEARPEYLAASLSAIRERYGLLDAYLAGPLGVTPERRAALERNLLR